MKIMSKKSFAKMFRPSLILLVFLGVGLIIVGQSGCSHKKTNRGHLFRCDWAFEYNRTPWIGCPPDSGCDDERSCSCGLGDCSGKNCSNKGFRRHCGLNPECTAKKPCCRNLGCGMWIDPSNPNSFAGMGTGAKACGMTPFCSPMKPCCLTPLCGRTSTNSPMMLGSQGMMMEGVPGVPTTVPSVSPGMTPTSVQQKGDSKQEKPTQKPPTMAGPTGLLISQGIVPGVSTITTGGVVAAAGVSTPVGMMTPAGVQLPNGTINNQVVLRACGLHPSCNAGRPCCMTANCGNVVPIAMVSNNAVHLASALVSNTPGGVMQAGGMGVPVGGRINGMLVNPISGQPVYGMSMNGMPQVGYPPIGYTPSGYSPKYPRFDGLGMGMGMMQNQQQEQDEEEEVEENIPEESPITKSQMPVPRFHPVPSKPAFQRSQGMPVTPRSAGNTQKISSNRRRASASVAWLADDSLAHDEPDLEGFSEGRGEFFSQASINTAVKKAYLEGMSAAMEEVEAELDAKEQKRREVEMQAKVLDQAKKLQAKIDSQSQEPEAEQNEKDRLRGQELLAEQERLQQLERQEQLQARREGEQRRRERQLREEAAMLQAQKNQILQAQMLASMPQMQQPVQQAGFNTSEEKGFLASTVSFLKGSEQRPTPQTQQQAAIRMMQQQRQSAEQPDKEIALIQSAKSLGSDLVSPLNGLLGSSNKSQQRKSKTNQTNAGYSPMQQTNLSAEQQQALINMQQMQLQQIRQNNGNSRSTSLVQCPPKNVSQNKSKTYQQNGNTVKKKQLAQLDIPDSFDGDKPQRPPTGVRQNSQAKKIIEVDDFYNDSAIRQANYIDCD